METTANTTAEDVVDSLVGMLEFEDEDNTFLLDTASVRTFNEAGVMTTNDGLVLRLTDGSEFQITVVRSR